MNREIELILTKLKIVSEEEQKGMYLCDKEHSKILLDYITNLQQIEQDHQRINGELREENKKLQEEIERQSKAQVILDNQIADMQQNLWEEQELSELFKDKYEKMKENAEILSNGYNNLEKANEKAMELLKEFYDSGSCPLRNISKAYEILNGDDKDES